MFKVGDKVRKKDGSKFLNGRKEAEVTKVIGTTVVLNEIIGVHESEIEKVEEDKELTFKPDESAFKVGDKVRRKDGEKFLSGKEIEIIKGEHLDLKGYFQLKGTDLYINKEHIEKVEEKSLEDTAYELGTKSTDNINPDHYKTGGIETINYIKAKLTEEEYKGYLKGNIIKYISRAEQKNGVEDYKKAQWYTNRLVEVTE